MLHPQFVSSFIVVPIYRCLLLGFVAIELATPPVFVFGDETLLVLVRVLSKRRPRRSDFPRVSGVRMDW